MSDLEIDVDDNGEAFWEGNGWDNYKGPNCAICDQRTRSLYVMVNGKCVPMCEPCAIKEGRRNVQL